MFGDNAGFVLKHVPYSEIRRMGERGSWIHDRASATESMIGDVRESSIDDRLSTYIVEDPGTGIPLQYVCFHGRTPDSMTDMGTTITAMSHTCDATCIWPLEPSALLAAFVVEVGTCFAVIRKINHKKCRWGRKP